jgi:glycosyltransferase involved in cell wall biosynthesis
VLVEAMAMGTPVVSTDCPHGPAEIIDNGGTGLLVPPEDSDALSVALQKVIDDRELRLRLGKAGQAHAQVFSSERIGSVYAAHFRKFAAQHGDSK